MNKITQFYDFQEFGFALCFTLMIKIASLKPMKVTVTTSGCQCKQSYILLLNVKV